RPPHQPFPPGIELFLPAMPSSSREEPTVRKTLTVATRQSIKLIRYKKICTVPLPCCGASARSGRLPNTFQPRFEFGSPDLAGAAKGAVAVFAFFGDFEVGGVLQAFGNLPGVLELHGHHHIGAHVDHHD